MAFLGRNAQLAGVFYTQGVEGLGAPSARVCDGIVREPIRDGFHALR